MIHAIPTVYRGVRMRSRLEARVAAVFDALGWSWEYEPIELRGYFPDFLVDVGDPYGDRPLLVEVKPYLATSLEARQAAQKIERSGWPGEAVVIGGATALLGQRGHMGPLVWSPAEFVRHTAPAHAGDVYPSAHWTLRSLQTPRACRTCYEREFTPDVLTLVDNFHAIWIEAGNVTQWRAP